MILKHGQASFLPRFDPTDLVYRFPEDIRGRAKGALRHWPVTDYLRLYRYYYPAWSITYDAFFHKSHGFIHNFFA